MSSDLRKSARRVQGCLAELDGEYEVREFSSSTRTAKDAADSIGCEVAQIAKSLVFRDKASGDPILVIASGANRVDVKKIRAATGMTLKRADGEFVRQATGFAIGGIPPIGHDVPLRTFLDRDLIQYPIIWAAAGTPHAVFRLTPNDLSVMTGGNWLDIREEG